MLPLKPTHMRLILAKKVPLFFIAFIVVSTLFFFSCQKELSEESNGLSGSLPDFTTKVSSSVTGFITDENDLPIANALVSMGSATTASDKYGLFEIKNAQVVKDAAVVTVIHPGYFKGIKTYMATAGKAAFFRIKLIPKIIAGSVNAASGGNITLINGLVVNLPANGVINAATNAAYTGQVNIAAHWINPTGNELNRTMPGDLRGVDTAGSVKLLTTYGMAAVELTGSAGELLQMATGKKATLTIPLPSALSASAPTYIPLWYFDETTGLWKEEGKAVKTGNSYIGEVSHFSYWNCDMPSNFVKFNCTITNAKGVPITNAYVKISVVGEPQRAGFGYTDSTGYTSGAIPKNTQMLLEVFGEYNCLSGLYAKNFTTGSADISLGKITVSTGLSASITGNVNNCSNAAVTDGFIIMQRDGLNYYQPLSSTGTFGFVAGLCDNSTTVSFFAEDKSASKASDALTFTILPGENAIGTLIACKVSTLQFLNYSVNGTNYSFTSPADSLTQYTKPQNTPPSLFIVGSRGSNTAGAYIIMSQTGIALNSLQNLNSFNCPEITNSATIVAPITVKITEYGFVGQYMAGNFNGTFRGPAPGNILYQVACSFRVKRAI
jgi:hypothetical protein